MPHSYAIPLGHRHYHYRNLTTGLSWRVYSPTRAVLRDRLVPYARCNAHSFTTDYASTRSPNVLAYRTLCTALTTRV